MPRAHGIERITQGELKGELAIARQLDADHVKHCPDCMGAKARTTDRCETGRESAKRVSRAESALRRWQDRPVADQLTMFD